jgi:hypothetical protein
MIVEFLSIMFASQTGSPWLNGQAAPIAAATQDLPSPTGQSHKDAFAELGQLVGAWESVGEAGRRHTVSYRLTANGSVLVETWTLAPGREALTLYYKNGGMLKAAHYCPQGNQPRLRVDGGDSRAGHMFREMGGSNLNERGGYHQHAFWLHVAGRNAFSRPEFYAPNVPLEASSAPMDNARLWRTLRDSADAYRRIE